MSGNNIEIITKPGSNFAPTFVDQHLLPGNGLSIIMDTGS